MQDRDCGDERQGNLAQDRGWVQAARFRSRVATALREQHSDIYSQLSHAAIQSLAPATIWNVQLQSVCSGVTAVRYLNDAPALRAEASWLAGRRVQLVHHSSGTRNFPADLFNNR